MIFFLANQWKDVHEEDKKEWKRRAQERFLGEQEEGDHTENLDGNALQTHLDGQDSDGTLFIINNSMISTHR